MITSMSNADIVVRRQWYIVVRGQRVGDAHVDEQSAISGGADLIARRTPIGGETFYEFQVIDVWAMEAR